MDRWTQDELNNTDNLLFAVSILNERRNKLNPYSPLATKLAAAAREIEEIRAETQKFLLRVRGINAKYAGEKQEEVSKGEES